MTNKAVKFDQEKVRLDLIPAGSLMHVGQTLTYGATKYSERNWEQGLDYHRLYGAAQRHMASFWMGENWDPESNLHHLGHAATCIMMLLHYELHYDLYRQFDNRPTYENATIQTESEQTENPRRYGLPANRKEASRSLVLD